VLMLIRYIQQVILRLRGKTIEMQEARD